MSERQQTAFVTGASSGIGFELCKQLAQKEFKVYAAARRVELIEPLKKYGDVVPIKFDVTSVEQTAEIKTKLINELKDGKLDILYNNAGASCTFPAVDSNDELTKQAFEVNVFAPMRITREFLPMVINAKGTVVFTGSLSGIIAYPFSSVYCSAKAAIHQYAHALHLEMEPFDVRVINVITGGVDTDIADKRPLASNSIYNNPIGNEIMENRREMSKRNKPMSPELYATKVIKDLLDRNYDPVDVYRGTLSSVLGFVASYLPIKWIEWGLVYKFKLAPLYKYFKSHKEELKIE